MIKLVDLCSKFKPNTLLQLDVFNESHTDPDGLPILMFSCDYTVRDLFYNDFNVQSLQGEGVKVFDSCCKVISCGRSFVRLRVFIKDN